MSLSLVATAAGGVVMAQVPGFWAMKEQLCILTLCILEK